MPESDEEAQLEAQLAEWRAARERLRDAERAARRRAVLSIAVGLVWRTGAAAIAAGLLVLVLHVVGAPWTTVVIALLIVSFAAVVWIVLALADEIGVWRQTP